MFRKLLAGVLAGMACMAAPVQATMVLNASRVILQDGRSEVSFGIRSLDRDGGFLAQSWLTPAVGDGEVEHFSLTPQLVQVQAGSEQRVRILYEGIGMPADRESMFWLNVQEIPQREAQTGSLQIAVLQRIKFFYRPNGLKGNSMQAAANLGWQWRNGELQVANASAFHVTIVDLAVADHEIQSAIILAPGESRSLVLSASQQNSLIRAQGKFAYATVNDYGAHDQREMIVPVAGQPAK